MDFEKFLSQVSALLADSDNAYLVLYAIATCVLTQFVKKLVVNKAKVDVLHKFDLAPILPFIIGSAFAVLDVYGVRGVRVFNVAVVLRLLIDTLSIGALATTGYRLVKSASGQSLSALMKNDLFGVFYTQLLYFGNVRQRIEDNKLTMQDFISQVKLLVSSAEQIYGENISIDQKRCKLARLLNGIVDDAGIESCINVLNEALQRLIGSAD